MIFYCKGNSSIRVCIRVHLFSSVCVCARLKGLQFLCNTCDACFVYPVMYLSILGEVCGFLFLCPLSELYIHSKPKAPALCEDFKRILANFSFSNYICNIKCYIQTEEINKLWVTHVLVLFRDATNCGQSI